MNPSEIMPDLSVKSSWRRDLLLGWASVLRSSRMQLFYIGGLVLQRGLPFLLMPVLIHLYSPQTFALYILFYSTVQLSGIVCSLAVPLSPIAFWSQIERKQTLVVTASALMFVVLTTLSLGAAVPLFSLYRRIFPDSAPLGLTIVAVIYLILYALNQFLISLLRAADLSRTFFFGQLLCGTVFVAASTFHASQGSFLRLISAYIASVLLQNLVYVIGLSGFFRQIHPSDLDLRLARQVLSYSVPLVLYTGAVLFINWIDKYLVRLNFSGSEFSSFTITVQYAYAQAYISLVLGFCTFPMICRFVAGNMRDELKRFFLTFNSLIFAIGVLYAAVVLVLDRWMYPLHINRFGFTVLSSGFIIWNLSANYVNVLYAHRHTLFVAILQTCNALVLATLVAVACKLHWLVLCYWDHVIVSTIFLVGSMWGCRLQDPRVTTPVVCSGAGLHEETLIG